jgi:hypothetical protein
MKIVPQKALKQKSLVITDQALMLGFFGRDGVIRTLDPLHPMQVRYRAALRPDDASG